MGLLLCVSISQIPTVVRGQYNVYKLRYGVPGDGDISTYRLDPPARRIGLVGTSRNPPLLSSNAVEFSGYNTRPQLQVHRPASGGVGRSRPVYNITI